MVIKRSLRISALVAAVLMLSSLLAACGRSSNDGGDKLTIALAVGDINDPFFQKVKQGAQEEADKLGVNLEFQGGKEFKVAAMDPVISTLLTKQPDAVAVGPVDPRGSIPGIKRFADAGIPIVTFDSFLDNPPFAVASEILSNNRLGGEMAADLLAKATDEKGSVASISTDTANTVLADRADGFSDQLKKKYPNMKLIAKELIGLDYPRAQTTAQALLTKNKNLAGIFTTCGACTEYASRGISQLNKQDTVAHIGYEASDREIELVRQGVIDALVVQDPAKEGALAVRYATMAAKKKTADIPKKVSLDPVVIDGDNVEKMKKYYYTTKGGTN